MKKLRKILAIGVTGIMVFSAINIGALAAEYNMNMKCILTDNMTGEKISGDEITPDGIVLDGELGQIYKSGGLVWQIIGKDGQTLDDNSHVMPRSSKVAFNVPLSGTTRQYSFTLSGNYKYWKVWFQNTQSATDQTIVTIEDANGQTIGDVAYIPGGTTAQLYSDKDSDFPSGTYKVNYTSGNANLSGTTACRLATTWAELDVTE